MKYLTILLLAACILMPSASWSGKYNLEHKAIATVELPKPKLTSDFSIEKVLNERRSVRNYHDEPLTLEEVSQLLWSAYGITYTKEGLPDFIRGGFKTAPSAGARYPLEIYLECTAATPDPPPVISISAR